MKLNKNKDYGTSCLVILKQDQNVVSKILQSYFALEKFVKRAEFLKCLKAFYFLLQLPKEQFSNFFFENLPIFKLTFFATDYCVSYEKV